MKNKTLSVPSLPQPVLAGSLQVAGLDWEDNSNAFFTCAEFVNGETLTPQQLDILTDSENGSIFLQEMACNPW